MCSYNGNFCLYIIINFQYVNTLLNLKFVHTCSSSQSPVTHADTTDVQDVRVGLTVESTSAPESTITVYCDYIANSDAQGCMVVLVSEFNNVTVNLTRIGGCSMKNFPGLDKKITAVFGFDIEKDGSIGTVAIPGSIKAITSSSWCRTGGLQPSAPSIVGLSEFQDVVIYIVIVIVINFRANNIS